MKLSRKHNTLSYIVHNCLLRSFLFLLCYICCHISNRLLVVLLLVLYFLWDGKLMLMCGWIVLHYSEIHTYCTLYYMRDTPTYYPGLCIHCHRLCLWNPLQSNDQFLRWTRKLCYTKLMRFERRWCNSIFLFIPRISITQYKPISQLPLSALENAMLSFVFALVREPRK